MGTPRSPRRWQCGPVRNTQPDVSPIRSALSPRRSQQQSARIAKQDITQRDVSPIRSALSPRRSPQQPAMIARRDVSPSPLSPRQSQQQSARIAKQDISPRSPRQSPQRWEFGSTKITQPVNHSLNQPASYSRAVASSCNESCASAPPTRPPDHPPNLPASYSLAAAARCNDFHVATPFSALPCVIKPSAEITTRHILRSPCVTPVGAVESTATHHNLSTDRDQTTRRTSSLPRSAVVVSTGSLPMKTAPVSESSALNHDCPLARRPTTDDSATVSVSCLLSAPPLQSPRESKVLGKSKPGDVKMILGTPPSLRELEKSTRSDDISYPGDVQDVMTSHSARSNSPRRSVRAPIDTGEMENVGEAVFRTVSDIWAKPSMKNHNQTRGASEWPTNGHARTAVAKKLIFPIAKKTEILHSSFLAKALMGEKGGEAVRACASPDILMGTPSAVSDKGEKVEIPHTSFLARTLMEEKCGETCRASASPNIVTGTPSAISDKHASLRHSAFAGPEFTQISFEMRRADDEHLSTVKSVRTCCRLAEISMMHALRTFRDAAQQGKLTQSRFLEIYELLLQEIGQEQVCHEVRDVVFCLFDRDGNGCVDMLELICGTALLCRANEREKVEAFFFVLDSNGDGFVTINDMINFIATVWTVVHTGDDELFRETNGDVFNKDALAEQVVECFLDADLDRDGVLSLEDFRKWFQAPRKEPALLFTPVEIDCHRHRVGKSHG